MATVAEIKRVWIALLAVAVWLTTAVGSFLAFSVDLSSTSSLGTVFVGATNALVAALSGLFLLIARTRTELFDRKLWLVCSIVSLVAFLVFLFLYVALQSIWTCPYARGTRLVIGAEPLPLLLDYLKAADNGFTCKALLDFAGDTFRLFAATNLVFRFLVLAATYVSAWFSLTALVFSIGMGLTVRRKVTRKPAKAGST